MQGGLLQSRGEEPPGTGYALELMFATILEVNARGPDQVSDHARRQDFAWGSQGFDPLAGVDGDANQLAATALRFPRMHASPNLETSAARSVSGSGGAAKGSGGAVERNQEAIPD